MSPRSLLLNVTVLALVTSCGVSTSAEQPDADEMWRRSQLVFPALGIDAEANEWTAPDQLTEQFGFVCWPDAWPDAYPAYLNAEELTATAVIACAPLNGRKLSAAVAYIARVDVEVADEMFQRAADSLDD
ncbi:MAG: hypothetical protein Q7V88_12815 [Actinomycetota bacterium]|nr:hypothetical protein [Actinomycetota bacterium]